MKAEKIACGVRVDAKKYVLEIDTEQLLARLDVKDANLYYYMSLLSAVDRVGEVDETADVQLLGFEESSDGVTIEIGSTSNIWDEKKLVYHCLEDTLECELVVKGQGKIDRVYFFRGKYKGNQLGSIPGFDYVFPAVVNFLEKSYFHASEYTSINAGHENNIWGFALDSGPLCFAFTNDFQSPWLSIGLAPATEDEYCFQSYEFNHKPEVVKKEHDSIVGTQSLSISYYGHKDVAGQWQSPKLVFNFADDKFEGIQKYVQWLFDKKYLPSGERETFDWWSDPIFCGWHEQVALAQRSSQETNLSKRALEGGGLSSAVCTQENHDKWLEILDNHNIKPGVIIIDAIWQIAHDMNNVDESKWPDLRSFVDKCHDRGQKVLLHLNCWSKKLSPDDECILMDGEPICTDPTNPKHVESFREQMRLMLSDEPDCYNADGFKIDGTSLQPYGYGMKTYGDKYGFELKRIQFKLMYDLAKAIKPDALVSTFAANPLFNDVSDVVRIGDMYSVKGDPGDSMRLRTRLIEIGMPDNLIDTDGNFRFSMRPDFIKLIHEQNECGIPCIYNAEKVFRSRTFNLPMHSKLTEEDYKQIAKAYAEYKSRKVVEG